MLQWHSLSKTYFKIVKTLADMSGFFVYLYFKKNHYDKIYIKRETLAVIYSDIWFTIRWNDILCRRAHYFNKF